MTETHEHAHSHGRPMHCMEIFGGSSPRAEAVTMPGLEGWVYSQPFEGAGQGGDIHYVSLCGGGTITRLIVADVSGHGREVAGFSASLRGLMRKNINRKSQAKLVVALNREFSALAQLRRFATAVVATYLATDRSLSICNAGHPRPLWYHAADHSWTVLAADAALLRGHNLPLGIDDGTDYDQFAVVLSPGDLVVFYTDALIEAHDGSGAMLGEDGLLALASALDPFDPTLLGPALLGAVESHRSGALPDDDVTLLVLRHTAAGPRHPPLIERLDVYAKVFGLKAV